jgi:hypothetical protein
MHWPGQATIESNNFLDIDFQSIRANGKARRALHITDELASDGMPVTCNLVDCQLRFHSHLVNEQQSHNIGHIMLADSQQNDQEICLVLQTVACIQHLEKRIGH